MTAALDHFVAEKPDTDRVSGANPGAHRAVDFKRQPHAILPRPAVHIMAIVPGAQERSHRISVRVVKLYSVEAGFTSALGGLGEEPGQHLREFANMRQIRVGDTLAIPVAQRFKLAF